jgi:hypothetical protein
MWLAPLFIIDLIYNDFLDARCKYTDEAFHWDVRRFSNSAQLDQKHNLCQVVVVGPKWGAIAGASKSRSTGES